MTTAALTEISKVATAIEGFEVRPWAFEARQLGPVEPGQAYTGSVQTQFGVQRPAQGFALAYKFDLDATAVGATKPYLHLAYEVIATYSVRGSVTDEQIMAFAETNGMLHVYPYFRVFVQTTCAQLSLPALTLPVHLVATGPARTQATRTR